MLEGPVTRQHPEPDESIQYHHVCSFKAHINIIPYLGLAMTSNVFLSGCTTKVSYAFLVYPMRHR
jgi:hypothetical protein